MPEKTKTNNDLFLTHFSSLYMQRGHLHRCLKGTATIKKRQVDLSGKICDMTPLILNILHMGGFLTFCTVYVLHTVIVIILNINKNNLC